MLSGEGNGGERWNRTIGLITKKATLHVQHNFCTFLCCCFARLQRETSRNFSDVTRCLEEMSFLCSFTFFPLPLIFTLHWWLKFLILSPPLQNFHVVLPTQKGLLSFIISRSRCLSPFFSLSFAGLPPTFSFPQSFSSSIFQICGHDN